MGLAAKVLAALAVAALTGCTMASDTPTPAPAQGRGPGGLMAWPDLTERPRPTGAIAIAYGPDSMQVVDLWLPPGGGPHPVVLMVHGGCWQTAIADRRLMDWAADDLRSRGIAVWNIDYRGVDRDGGGYPGTFLDVAAAADSLRTYAQRYHLDLSRVVAVGHSAGGHLALWLAARRSPRAGAANPLIPRGSPLRAGEPLPIRAVISLGGLPDLELAATPPGSGCGTEIVERLVGPPTMNSRHVYADTSVPRLLPLGVPQVLINGREDRIIPVHFASDYEAKARAAGDDVRVRMIERTGHVELISPGTVAWGATVEEIERALRRSERR